MLLASRDEEILHTLARKVRLFTLEQLVGHWWTPSPSGTANARKRLRQMLDAGLLQRHRVNARPLPKLSEPVVTWSVDEPIPDFGAATWELQNRWEKPPVATTVYLATRRTANLYGGKNRGRLKHAHQATHDLGVSAVYLSLLKKDPPAAADWVGEDLVPPEQFGGKVPDAVLGDGLEAIRLVIEFGGAYDAVRVKEFHDSCAGRAYPTNSGNAPTPDQKAPPRRSRLRNL